MKVRATALGFYGHRRRPPGEVFVLKPYKKVIKKLDEATKEMREETIIVSAEEQFSTTWMERADNKSQVQPLPTQRQFGPNVKTVDTSRSAKAAHEPLSDEDALQRDEDLEESQSEQSVL